jgi:hypothetical protein
MAQIHVLHIFQVLHGSAGIVSDIVNSTDGIVIGQGVVTLSHAPGAGEDEDAFAAEDEKKALEAASAKQASAPVVQSKASAPKPTENAATNPELPYKSDDFDFDLADLDI